MLVDNITEEEFGEWLQSPVTRTFIQTLKRHAESYMLALATSAGIDPLQDRFVCGKIDTYLEVSNITFEEIGES